MNNVARVIRRFLLALSFLTVLPIPLVFFKKEIENKENINTDFSKASIFFPLIGLLIGGILYAFYLFFRYIDLPVHLESIFILTVWLALSGGLHMEGLADMIDGFSGGEEKKDIIRIMKDGSVGAKGAIVLILTILLKYLLLFSLTEPARGISLLLAPVLGRWSMVLLAYSGKPASVSNTLTKLFTNYLGKKEFLISTFFAVTISLLIFFHNNLFYQPIILLLITAGTTIYLKTYSDRKIDGICGDVIGAANEINELIVLLISFFIIN